MIKNFLVINCTGKNNVIALRINNNFFFKKLQTNMRSNELLVNNYGKELVVNMYSDKDDSLYHSVKLEK